MKIVVTGATGGLGRAVVESLLTRGVDPADVIAVGRSVEKIADLAARGVDVRQAGYDEPAALEAAFAGADRLVLVSGIEPGKRVQQHLNAINAAKAAGIQRIAYTSLPHAATSDMILATEHRATEEALTASGIPSVFLRNGWYLENYDVKGTVERGNLTRATGAGKISIVPRTELGEAAAAAIMADNLDKQAYELGGEAVTMGELAAELSRQSGKDVTYTNLAPSDFAGFLVKVGVPPAFAEVLADSDRSAASGGLHTGTADLQALLGRPVTPLADAVKSALA